MPQGTAHVEGIYEIAMYTWIIFILIFACFGIYLLNFLNLPLYCMPQVEFYFYLELGNLY